MAIYTTYFVVDEKALLGLFPGWLAPRVEPFQQEETNPFTGERVLVNCWDPEPVERDPEPDNEIEPDVAAAPAALDWISRVKLWWSGRKQSLRLPNFTVTSIDVAYEKFLENRAPDPIKGLPHWCGKRVDSMLLFSLYNNLHCKPCDLLAFMEKPALIGPQDYPAMLQTVPSELTQKLAELDASSAPAAAENWGDAEEWEKTKPSYILEVVNELVALARHARTKPHELYLLTEW